MEYNTLPLKKNVQKKFYEWFGEPVITTEPSLPLAEDLQEKFCEWFGDIIPDTDPSFTTIVNSSMEDPVSVDPSLSAPVSLPFPTTIRYSQPKTAKNILEDLKKIMAVVGSSLLRAEMAYLTIGLFLTIGTIDFLRTGAPNPLRVGAPQSTMITSSTLTANISTPTPISTVSVPTPTSTSVAMIKPTSTITIRNMAPSAPTVPSATPVPSDTLIGLMKIGYLSQVGPLSLTDQLRVYESALKHIGISTDEIQLMGEQVNGPGYGSPDNICGPLSLAILQEAGIVRADINPHSFWLLNPDVVEKRKLLAEVFPPDRFENIRFRIPLKNMDWQTNPLYPGDFLYIYAGTGGTFEHMLVVNRVDSEGRAYSVNNYLTPNGFIISEVLLYDPADPSAGIFPAWTARPNSKSGSTGFAGFEVWRLKMP